MARPDFLVVKNLCHGVNNFSTDRTSSVVQKGLRLTVMGTAWPSPSRAWWAVAVFSAAAILSYTDRQVLSLLVDPLKADLHITDSQVGVLQGLAFALIYSVAGLPLGRLADLAPRRLVIVLGVLVFVLGTGRARALRLVGERTGELRHQALHDALTGLPNRALLTDRLVHGLAGSRRRGTQVGVIFLDVDHFKVVNDSLGHTSGDDLLRQAAERIACAIKSSTLTGLPMTLGKLPKFV